MARKKRGWVVFVSKFTGKYTYGGAGLNPEREYHKHTREVYSSEKAAHTRGADFSGPDYKVTIFREI